MKFGIILSLFLFTSTGVWAVNSVDEIFKKVNKERPKSYKEYLISNYDLLILQEQFIFNKKQQHFKSTHSKRIKNFNETKEMHKKLGKSLNKNKKLMQEIFEKQNDFNDQVLEEREKFMKKTIGPLLVEFSEKFGDRKKKFRRVFQAKK